MNYILTRKTLIKNILRITIPTIMEMSLTMMLAMVDTIMISKMISPEALAGVGIANSIFFLLVFVFSSFNIGAVAMIARRFGEKNIPEVKKIAGNNLSLNLLLGLIISIISLSAKNLIFMPYDITREVLTNGLDYYQIVVVGMIFQFGSFAFAAASRGGVANTKTPMYVIAFTAIFNTILNFFLIKGLWIFPTMGIQGAALATTIARATAFLIYIYIFTSGSHFITLTTSCLIFKKKILKQLWKISYPGAIEQIITHSAFLVIGVIVSLLDTSSEVVYRVLFAIESTGFMPAIGLSIATATLVGNALGEKDKSKAMDIGYISTLMGALWGGVIVGLVFIFFPIPPLLSIFTNDQTVIATGIGTIKIMALAQVFLTSYIVMSGALRGAGDTGSIMKITSLKTWSIFIPMSYIMIRYTQVGIASIWYAKTISFFVFLVILIIQFSKGKWAQKIV